MVEEVTTMEGLVKTLVFVSPRRRSDDVLASPPDAAIKVARGRLAQLVERLLYTQDVGGSSPSPPTSLPACGASALASLSRSRGCLSKPAQPVLR